MGCLLEIAQQMGHLAHGTISRYATAQSGEVCGLPCKLHPSFAISSKRRAQRAEGAVRFDGPVDVNKPTSLGGGVPGLTPPRPRTQTRFVLKIHLQGSNPRLQGFALCHTVAPDTQVLGCAYPCPPSTDSRLQSHTQPPDYGLMLAS